MKKVSSVLISIGFLGLMLCILLGLMHMDMRNVFMGVNILFLAGIVLYMSSPHTKSKRYTIRQKIFMAVLYAGCILTIIGSLLKYFYWPESRYFLIAGTGMMLVFFLYIAVVIVADKLRINPKGKPTTAETLAAFGLTANDLEQYEGVYSNDGLPLKITITSMEAALIAQATGQAAFYLEMTGKNVFNYYGRKNIVLEFDLEKNELILKQHGGYFPFIKE